MQPWRSRLLYSESDTFDHTSIRISGMTGVQADRVVGITQQNWKYLLRQKGVLDNPNYLRERGKPSLSELRFISVVSDAVLGDYSVFILTIHHRVWFQWLGALPGTNAHYHLLPM